LVEGNKIFKEKYTISPSEFRKNSETNKKTHRAERFWKGFVVEIF